jgi:hypothetical protein
VYTYFVLWHLCLLPFPYHWYQLSWGGSVLPFCSLIL